MTDIACHDVNQWCKLKLVALIDKHCQVVKLRLDLEK